MTNPVTSSPHDDARNNASPHDAAHNKGFGWRPDLPDQRDRMYTPMIDRAMAGKPLPEWHDLRHYQWQYVPPVYDQESLGSCTAQGAAALHEYMQLRLGSPKPQTPSRLFIYLETRRLINTLDYDSGAYIRDSMKVLRKLGAPPENVWPYNIDKFADAPPPSAYQVALDHQAVFYYRIPDNNLRRMQLCLSAGYPFVFGFTVYDSFLDIGPDGIMSMPAQTESVLGGHAVVAVGYNNERKIVACRNSWGANWGDKGHFLMPYDYITNPSLSDDFWSLRKIEVAAA